MIGVDTHCQHCGTPMKSCVIPGDCGCQRMAEILKRAKPLGTETVPKGRANEQQVGGSHYKVGGEEHWDRVARLGLDYFQSQITKYVERCWKKNGIQDLEKAAHFLQKYLELAKAGLVGPQAVGVAPSDQYSQMLQTPTKEQERDTNHLSAASQSNGVQPESQPQTDGQ